MVGQSHTGSRNMPRPTSECKSDSSGSEEQGRGECKSSSTLDASLLHAFADFGTSEGLAASVDDFIAAHCSCFAGAAMADEQPLERTALHREFVALIEGQLESFCKEHGASAERVFEALRAVREDESIAQEFVPLVVKMCDYEYFVVNMSAAADALSDRAVAAASGR